MHVKAHFHYVSLEIMLTSKPSYTTMGHIDVIKAVILQEDALHSQSVFHLSGKKRAHKLKKIPGTPAGCPWDTRRDKQGSTGWCPGDFVLFTIEKRTEKGIFAGTPAGCPRDTRPSRRSSENVCDFFLCAFSAP